MEIRYIERDLIIEINRKIIEEWNNRHPEQPECLDVSESRLDEVSEIVKNAGNEIDLEEQIIIKAANLMGGLAWAQAFSDANKRTGSYHVLYFYEEMAYNLQYLHHVSVNYERCCLMYRNKEMHQDLILLTK